MDGHRGAMSNILSNKFFIRGSKTCTYNEMNPSFATNMLVFVKEKTSRRREGKTTIFPVAHRRNFKGRTNK